MKFCTVVNCIDGRVQFPVLEYLRTHYTTSWIDSVTQPGPELVLSDKQNSAEKQSILTRVTLSIERHDSKDIAIVAHYDCAANPAPKETQLTQLAQAQTLLQTTFPHCTVISLYVNSDWEVEVVETEQSAVG